MNLPSILEAHSLSTACKLKYESYMATAPSCGWVLRNFLRYCILIRQNEVCIQ